MPSTYLLLRNNKQTGPYSLQELLQQGLKPQDLIWVEGQSAGWSYPTEINTLKSYVTEQGAASNKVPEQKTETKPATSSHSSALHIYVSLPAGNTPKQEVPATSSLEAKAEALYQRVQAFAEHKVLKEETETRYARSMEDMKEEYSAWMMQQRKKKKSGSYKKKLVIATSVLVITTTGFGISKWMSSRSFSKLPLATYALETLKPENKQLTTASFHTVADSVTTTSGPLFIKSDTAAKQQAAFESNVKPAAAPKKKAPAKVPVLLPMKLDTASTASVPEPQHQTVPELKRTVPLSRLVAVTGTVQYTKNGKANNGTQVTLQNNSSELLKTVSVVVSYYKKEDKLLDKEMVYFYNVQPGTAPVINAAGNRRATSVHFDIGTITRADGSLYLIH